MASNNELGAREGEWSSIANQQGCPPQQPWSPPDDPDDDLASGDILGGYWKISSQRTVDYEIIESQGLLSSGNATLARAIRSFGSGHTQLFFVDDAVAAEYGMQLEAYCRRYGISPKIVMLRGDESNKSFRQVEVVLSALNALGTLRRSSPPVAIGGGVVLDIVGLAASLFRRGIPYIRVPTTLLSLVDVAVAVKTGVNFEGCRNRVGSYSPPPVTFLDTTFLRTVPDRHIRNGMGEVLKMALVSDVRLLGLLEKFGPDLVDRKCDSVEGREVIRRSIEGMVSALGPDPWELNLKRTVDYGHSFSPLIELTSLPDLLHGEAVALDCLYSAFLANLRGLLPRSDVRRMLAVMTGLGLPTFHRGFSDPDLLWASLQETRRHRDGQQNLPLLTGFGSITFVNDVDRSEIAAAARLVQHLPGGNQPKPALVTDQQTS